jgi:hypothetical protein
MPGKFLIDRSSQQIRRHEDYEEFVDIDSLGSGRGSFRLWLFLNRNGQHYQRTFLVYWNDGTKSYEREPMSDGSITETVRLCPIDIYQLFLDTRK